MAKEHVRLEKAEQALARIEKLLEEFAKHHPRSEFREGTWKTLERIYSNAKVGLSESRAAVPGPQQAPAPLWRRDFA